MCFGVILSTYTRLKCVASDRLTIMFQCLNLDITMWLICIDSISYIKQIAVNYFSNCCNAYIALFKRVNHFDFGNSRNKDGVLDS